MLRRLVQAQSCSVAAGTHAPGPQLIEHGIMAGKGPCPGWAGKFDALEDGLYGIAGAACCTCCAFGLR